MNFSDQVRSTLELTYGDEVRDLRVTFDLMDRVRKYVPWEQIAVEMAKPEPVPDLGMMAKFVFLNLREAGFSPDFDQIYDEMIFSEDNKQGYMSIVAQLLLAYQPRGSAKKKQTVTPISKSTKRKRSKKVS